MAYKAFNECFEVRGHHMADVVQILPEVFLDIRKTIPDVPGPLKQKMTHLKNTYACFSPQSQLSVGKWTSDHKKGNHTRHAIVFDKHERIEKVRIGCRDLSRENLARKDFIALMNKLTFQNRDNIIKSIKQVFRDDCLSVYREITWDMMQRSPEFHELHSSVIDLIYSITEYKETWKTMWQQLGSEYETNRMWCPPEDVLHDDDYDEFCAFVKWKKIAIASIKAFVVLENRNWVCNLIDVLLEKLQISTDEQMELSQGKGDKIVDAYLEQIFILAEEGDERLYMWVRSLVDQGDKIRPSTRFKLYDLRDKLDTKLNLSCKNRR